MKLKKNKVLNSNTKEVSHNNDPESLRGLFVIVKGVYLPSVGVKSYDPEGEDTREHYMLMDRECFNPVACGDTLEKVLKSLDNTIRRYKTRKAYFKHLHDYTTEDYYHIHYEGGSPYSDGEVKMLLGSGGHRTRVSPIMKEHYKDVIDRYGEYFSDKVEEVEDMAYAKIKTPVERSMSKKVLVKRLPSVKTPKEEKKVLKKITPKKKGLVLKRKHNKTLSDTCEPIPFY